MRLLIVEDHAGMRNKLRELLAGPNVEMHECGTGEEAMWSVHDFQPDWIIMDVNLPGPFLACQAFGRSMLAQGTGSIVNIASVAGLSGVADRAAYNASKHGLIGLTRTLAVEWGGRGVRVNAVCPGLVKTPMDDESPGGVSDGDSDIADRVPPGRPPVLVDRRGEDPDVRGPLGPLGGKGVLADGGAVQVDVGALDQVLDRDVAVVLTQVGLDRVPLRTAAAASRRGHRCGSRDEFGLGFLVPGRPVSGQRSS
jgi:hypothetical protein